MSNLIPEYLVHGEAARLFPVLSNSSKEGRTTTIFLACVAKIDEFAQALLKPIGQRVGKRTNIETFTEVVLAKRPPNKKDRPDGVISSTLGSKRWVALIEAKVGSNSLNIEQIEKYRELAKLNGLDALITISNQFSTDPESHPIVEVRKSRLKIPVYHWSWMYILTVADLLLSNEEVADSDQKILLNELRRFLSHESVGVQGFSRMPKEWSDLNRLISSGGQIPVKSSEASFVVEAWFQEVRDLSLILTRMTETDVEIKLNKKHKSDPSSRAKDELVYLRDTKQLRATLVIKDAAAPLEITADITRRTIDVGMNLRAPEDKKSTTARVNWLLRQIKTATDDDLHIRLRWPGASQTTQHLASELLQNPNLALTGKEHLATTGFQIFHSKRLGARFTQQTNFVTDLEQVVPEFYRKIGSQLVAWRKPAPKVKNSKPDATSVSTSAISEVAGGFEPRE